MKKTFSVRSFAAKTFAAGSLRGLGGPRRPTRAVCLHGADYRRVAVEGGDYRRVRLAATRDDC
jgi:hypothetical protein